MEIALLVLAHPDDEELFAALIILLVLLGVEVVVYYATQGEGGETSGLCSPEELADVRYLENKGSMEIMGVNHVIRRDFGDGELADKTELLEFDIKSVLKQVRPKWVYTFPPSGITGHADHQTVQRATFSAIQEYSKDAEVELLYRVIPMGSKGIEGEGIVIHDQLAITQMVDAMPCWPQIILAVKAHRTQQRAMSTIFPALRQRRGMKSSWKTLPFLPGLIRRMKAYSHEEVGWLSIIKAFRAAKGIELLWPYEYYSSVVLD